MPIETKQRCSGTTTRIVDDCIQELFSNRITYIDEGNGTEEASSMRTELFYKFRRRMDIEHNHVNYTSKLITQDGITCFKVVIKE
jgi:hypothetical protein